MGIPSNPIVAFSEYDLFDPRLPRAIADLADVMRQGGLSKLEVGRYRLIRAATAGAEEELAKALKAPESEGARMAAALAARIAAADASVTDEQLLLDPMAGLRGGALDIRGQMHG